MRRLNNSIENKNINFWNKIASNYDKVVGSDEKLYKQIIEMLKETIKGKENILEIATGTGTLAIAISSEADKIEACDISTNMLSIAKKKAEENGCKNINFQLQDACALTYKPSSFDVVIISNALHIMPNPEMALKQIFNALKPNGILIAPTFLHGQTLMARMASKIMSVSGFKAYAKWNEKSFIKFLEDNGFIQQERKMFSGILPLLYVVARKREMGL